MFHDDLIVFSCFLILKSKTANGSEPFLSCIPVGWSPLPAEVLVPYAEDAGQTGALNPDAAAGAGPLAYLLELT